MHQETADEFFRADRDQTLFLPVEEADAGSEVPAVARNRQQRLTRRRTICHFTLLSNLDSSHLGGVVSPE
ncbi:MAG: hypothetical protein SGI92_08520 [Bryobacteraceae bacterium]|nr:hypothetical protein [Bryobacteraceae bacterium]